MLLRFVLICWDWRFIWWYIYDAYDMDIWRCMLMIHCNVSEKILVCMFLSDVYFLNICIIHVFYHFNRSRALHWAHLMCSRRICWAQFLCFSSFLGLHLQITYIRTWEQNSSHCKSLTRPLECSFLVFRKFSQIFGCSWFADLHDFFVNYFKNPIKLLCVGKTRITYSNIENITKVSKS